MEFKKVRGFGVGSCRVRFLTTYIALFCVALLWGFGNSALVTPAYGDSYSASLSGAGQVTINLMGNSNSDTEDSVITANTTCPNGYTVSVNGANDNETNDFSLYLDSDDTNVDDKFIASSGTLGNPVALGANSWGILVNNSLFSGITTAPVTWFDVEVGDYTPGVNNNHTFTFGASHDGSLNAGTYSMADNGRIVYTLELDNTCTNYTVIFDANEPTGTTASGSMPNQSITEGVPTPLTANAYEISGYAFTGWNTAADGSGTSYADGASVTNLAAANTSITLYAQWSQNIIQNYTGCPYLETGDTELLTDIRDGKTYWIAKMADGHCWMTQNLDLDLETTPSQVTALTSENTDLKAYNESGYTSANGYSQDSTTEVITWTPERATLTASELTASNWAASNSYTTNYSLDPGDYYYTDQFETSPNAPAVNLLDDDPASAQWQTFFSTTPFPGNGVHGYVGNYYTWSAAVASNDTSSYSASTYGNIGNNPKNSICPAGWRLPLTTSANPAYTYQGSFDEVKRLNYVLNNNQNITNNSSKLEAAPFYMTRAGYVDATEATGPMTRGGRGGGIWTSTIQSSTEAKTLYETSSSVSAPSNSKRNLGYPIRCVSRDEAIAEVTISFQANEPAGAGTATGSMAPQSVPIGLTVAINANAFELAGYIFDGWNTSADGTGTSYANGANIAPSANVTLYAQWVRSYGLTYDFGDETFDGASILNTNITLFDTNTVDKDFTVSFGISNVTPVSGQSDNFNNFAAAMSESGQPYPGFALRFKSNEDATKYKFVANATSSAKYDSGQTYFNDADGAVINRKGGFLYLNNGSDPVLDFNLLASPFNAPLTFGAGLNGSNNPFRFANATLSDIQVKIEYANADTITLPGPTKTGDTFLYWSTVADGSGTNYSAGTTITMTGSMTLYPIWQSDVPVVTHDITFLVNAPSGAPTPTGSMPTQSVVEGVATNLDANNYAISGYAFTGWNTAADGNGTPYADEASVTLTADLTLYAQWIVAANHTLTFNFGNESFDGTNYIDTKIKLFSSELRSKDFTLSFGISNQVFVTGQDGNFNNIANAMKEGSSPWPGFVVRLNQTYAGNNQYNFNANATTASADKANVVVSSASTTGFRLERINGSAYLNNNQTASLNFNNIQNPFDTPLTFGAGLNSSNQPFRYAHVNLSNIVLALTFGNVDTYTLPSPTKTLYRFVEWNTAADGNGTSYSAGTTVTMSSDLTLYPIWELDVDEYEITFHANEPVGTATGTMSPQTLYDGIEDNLNTNTFALADYIFMGWNTAADGSGTSYADGAPITITADTDLYAKWFAEADIVNYTVTYNIGDEAFDGTNYLRTGIQLFDDANVDRSFDIDFSIDSFTYLTNQDSNRNAFVTAMDESVDPYPGFVLRYANANAADKKYSLATYSSSSNKPKVETAMPSLPASVSISRNGRALSFNNESVINYSDIAYTFSRPLVFGASINKAGNGYYRHFQGSLSDITVGLKYTNIETVTVPSLEKPGHTFLEWNTAADGSGTSYAVGSTFTLSANLTLYPIWNIPVVNDYHEINLTSSRSASSETIDLTGMGMGSSVTFASDNTGVATVNASGTVTAVAPGEATITVVGDKRAYYNVYVSEPNVPLFNITPEPIQVYYNSRDAWDVTKTKADFLANLRATFEHYNCKIYNYTDNSGRLDSAIAYGWTDGTRYCDQSRAYDTEQTGALNVYLYDTANSQPTGSALTYTGAVAGKIYNMIPGETYYWELASDSSVNGLVKATGKHRILNFTQGDNSRVSGSQITRNTREIGGLPVDTNYDGTIDGYTKYGRIFRGERLWTSNGYNTGKLADLGANFEVDVRGSGEGTADSRLTGYANRTVVQYQIKQGVDTSNYNTMRNVVTQTMQNVINGDNIYFHCSYGSDRTGSLAWILEGLLGVTDEDRLGDYELSTFYGAVDRNRYFEYEGSNTKRFTYMMTFLQTGQDVYDWYMYGTSNRASDETLINSFRNAMVTYGAARQNAPQETTQSNAGSGQQNQLQSAPTQSESETQEANTSSEPEAENSSSSSESELDSQSESNSSDYAEPLGVTTNTPSQVDQSVEKSSSDDVILPLTMGLLVAGAAAATTIGAVKGKSEG